MWNPFRRKKIEDKLSISELFPRLSRKVRRSVQLNFGIDWGIFLTIYGALSSIGVYGATGVAIANILTYAVIAGSVMGLNMAVSSLTSKSGKQGSLSSGSVMMNTRMVTDPIKVVYGKRRIGASQVFIHTEGSLLNTYMHMIAVWGEGPVNGVAIDGAGEMIWIGERRIQELQNYFGESYVTHTFKNGSSDQAVDANLAAIFPAFADAMRYTAYSYFKFRFSQLLYSGFPQVTATIEGRTLFDPRDGSISYSTNPALVWRDFKSHPRYGGGIAGSLIDSQSVEDAATWCENNSYVFNGAISDRQSFLDTIEDILMNFRGEEIWSGGQYKLLIQTYSTPVMALDEKDIKIDDSRKNALGIQTAGIQDSPTRVKVTFGDIALNYTPNYAYWPQVPIVVSEGVELDRGTKEVELIGVTTYTQALKIAKYLFLKARWSRAFSAIVHPRLLALELGDMVSVSHNTAIPLGSIPEDWSNKVLRIASAAMTQDNQISVVFGEESSEIYDDTVEETTPHYAYNTTTPSFFDAPPDPANLTFNTGPDEQTSQKIDAYIDFFWDSMGNGLDYILRWRYDTVTTWTSHSVMKPMAVIGIPTPGTAALILQTSGEYSGTITKYYKVEIDGDGSPNTFKWSDDGGLTWEATGVEINPLAWQILNDGVRAKFNADTGGVLGDNFTFTATPRDINAERIGGLQCGKTVYWQIQAINDKNIKSEWITPNFPAMTWDPDAPTMGDVTLGSLSEGNSVLLKWTKAASDNELSEWIVYRNHVNDAPTAIILYHKYIKSRSYVDLTVITGVTYYYWLKCIDRFNRISSSFSNVTEIQFIHGVRSLAFETVGSGDIPAVDGAIGLIGTDVIGLENCDDYTHFTHDAADPQDILLGQETGDVKEGTGSLKISLSEYYTKFSFEETNEFYYGVTYRIGQNWGWKQYYSKGFKPTESLDCKAIGLKLTKTGAPENLIVEIYSDNAGKPGASLGSATLLSASVGTTLGAPPNDYTYAIFGTPISLTSGTLYHIVLNTQGIHLYDFYNIYGWYVINGTVNHFGDATERDYSSDDGTTWGLPFLDAYGNYDMNFKLCKASAALNKYVWATIAAKDISLKTYLKFWTKAARTGTNFQISFGESAIEEQLFNVPISVANTWEFKAISLSGVLAADRNAVTKIGIKITNVDESNIIYLDNIFCNIATPHPQIYIDGEWKRFVLEDDPSIAPGIVVLRPSGEDDTQAFKDAFLASKNRILQLVQGVYRITSKVSDTTAGTRIIRGMGAAYNDTVIPTTPKGTVIVWDGDPDDKMFEFGGDPLYIGGVWQNSTTWQNNVSLEDFTMHANKGAKSLVYIHDQDNFKAKGVFVNGFGEDELRGVFDIRGTVCNPNFKGVTIYDVPKGYGFRCGDSFVNGIFEQCCAQKTALGYWLGDCPTYERPWVDGMTKFDGCSNEGSVILGEETEPKWTRSIINGAFAAGVSVIAVADGTQFAIGDNVFIGRPVPWGADKFEMNYLTNKSGNNLTLKFPTEYAHTTGEIIKAGTIGFHLGGSYLGETTTVDIKSHMFTNVGSCIDAHDVDNLTVDMPRVPGGTKRVLFLDGYVYNTHLLNPDIWPPKYSDYKLFEITNRGHVYCFNWYGKPDKSGRSEPYINDQGEGDFNYIGSFQQTEGASSMPPYFRGITFDSLGGITLKEAGPDAFTGLFYKIMTFIPYTGTNVERIIFKVHPTEGITLNTFDVTKAPEDELYHAEITDILRVGPLDSLKYQTLTAALGKIETFIVDAFAGLSYKEAVDENGTWATLEVLKAEAQNGLIYKGWTVENGELIAFVAKPWGDVEITGKIKIMGGAPGLGKVLTSDANGLGSWEAGSGNADTVDGFHLDQGVNSTDSPTFDAITITSGIGTYLKATGPDGTAYTSKRAVMAGVQLSSGTVTVTLTGAAIFAGQYTYTVFVSRNGNTHGIRVTNNSGSSFTIESSDLTDTDWVSYMAVGN